VTLRDLMNRNARSIFGDAVRGYAESITYRFKSGDPDRTFNAHVRRLELTPSTPQAPQVSKRRVHVEIARHATDGVTTIADGDAIFVSMRIGGTPTWCRIEKVLRQNSALFVVEAQE
jgi:hypothetical protein